MICSNDLQTFINSNKERKQGCTSGAIKALNRKQGYCFACLPNNAMQERGVWRRVSLSTRCGVRGGCLTLFLDSMVRVKTAWERLLSLFMEVDATLLFTHPVRSTWTTNNHSLGHYVHVHTYIGSFPCRFTLNIKI